MKESERVVEIAQDQRTCKDILIASSLLPLSHSFFCMPTACGEQWQVEY